MATDRIFPSRFVNRRSGDVKTHPCMYLIYTRRRISYQLIRVDQTGTWLGLFGETEGVYQILPLGEYSPDSLYNRRQLDKLKFLKRMLALTFSTNRYVLSHRRLVAHEPDNVIKSYHIITQVSEDVRLSSGPGGKGTVPMERPALCFE